jgi:hypothetical protein
MFSMAVLETGSENISGIIARKLREMPESSTVRSLTFLNGARLTRGHSPDLLVVSVGKGQRSGRTLCQRCGILLMPGAAAQIASRLCSSCIVSYGMSKKDSVTISSIDENALVLSLQRELPTLSGRHLERQDIPMRRAPGTDADDMLASGAALLLLGVLPEELRML